MIIRVRIWRFGVSFVTVGVVTVWLIVVAFAVLEPDVGYGDSGVKFIQAGSLAARHGRSLLLLNRGAYLDPEGVWFPLAPPFVIRTAQGLQGVFSPATTWLFAPIAAVAGVRGMVLVSLVGAAALFLLAMRLGDDRDRWPMPLVLTLATPLWFYAITPSEHTAAAALGLSALVVVLTRSGTRASFVAGLLLGAATAFREETVLLLPGLLFAAWLASARKLATLVAPIAGLAASLIAAAALDAAYGRPPAVHLLQNVKLVQEVFGSASYGDPEGLTTTTLSLRERYDIVGGYWLLGSTKPVQAMALLGGVALAWMARGRWRAAMTLAVCAAAGVATTIALVDLLRAPRWQVGLLTLSPFLLFALLPGPDRKTAGKAFRVSLLAAGAYVVLCFAVVSHPGGKSLGPRLLLPTWPLLVHAALVRIRAWGEGGERSLWTAAVTAAGLFLLVSSVVLQMGVMVPAFAARNRDDALALDRLRSAPEQILVADDMFTAQLLAPLYFEKVVLLADKPDKATSLATRLRDTRVNRVILVSRSKRPVVSLYPMNPTDSQVAGRLTIQRWERR